MSTSQSSEKTLSPTPPDVYETKTFEKFGSTYTLNITKKTRHKWATVMRLPNGEVIDTTVNNWVQRLPAGQVPAKEWAPTGETLEVTAVVSAQFQDPDDGMGPIVVVSTPDGPIMGVKVAESETDLLLLHPCVIAYQGAIVKLSPIFNVAYVLSIQLSAVRSIMPPSEPLVAIYPGFVIQNRQGAYALKATQPVTSGPLDNDAADVTSH